jgi:hypothetical protein
MAWHNSLGTERETENFGIVNNLDEIRRYSFQITNTKVTLLQKSDILEYNCTLLSKLQNHSSPPPPLSQSVFTNYPTV